MMIDEQYLPFTRKELEPHFYGNAEKQIDYFCKSAFRYHRYMEHHGNSEKLQMKHARFNRQIEKDEKFWVVTALKSLFDNVSRKAILKNLLMNTFDAVPPLNGIDSWDECLDGNLELYFEASLSSPREYSDWARKALPHRQLIPYISETAEQIGSRRFEGATHADALLINPSNGFNWVIEAKVLSDISCQTTFDHCRNQIIRNIDVMLSNESSGKSPLRKRDPEKSIFSLLTPGMFKDYPKSRFYGWLMEEYKSSPSALERDLPHRKNFNAGNLSKRIGWMTYEDIQKFSDSVSQTE